MDIGSMCICMAIGALMCLIFTGIGVCFGRCDKEQFDDDSDVRVYIPHRSGSGSRDKRDYKPTAQEIEDVLYTLRIGASNREKRVIDYLIDKEET